MTQVLDTTTRNWPLAKLARASRNPLIQHLEAFAPLSSADETLILHHCAEARTYPADTDLLREDEAPDCLLAVLDGFACQHQSFRVGTRQITAYLVPGDICDAQDGPIARMNHSVSTLSPCRIARIPSEAVRRGLDPDSGLDRALRINSLVHSATLREWIVNIGCRSALERIAHLFCELSVRLGAVGLTCAGTFDLPLTQGDIATTVGLSSVHVNRSVQALRGDRLITLQGRRLTILDWVGLARIAEFDPTYLRLGGPAPG